MVKNHNTLELILRSASIFLSQNPRVVKPSTEASQSHTRRRCLARGTSFGLTTPPTRRGRKNSDSESESEPDSPRVSCVGQIEVAGRKKKKKKKKRKKIDVDEGNPRKHSWMWEKKRKMNGAEGSSVGAGSETAPYLNQMKRFASGRGSSLSDFEWKLVGVGGEGEPST